MQVVGGQYPALLAQGYLLFNPKRKENHVNLKKTLIVLDLETTGIWIDNDRIIDIAMIKCYVDGKQETYIKKVNPGIPIPARVTQLTGITDEDVKDAPAFKDIAPEVFEFLKDCDFAGFNVDKFDLPLLEREFRDAGIKFEWQKRKTYDAQKVYHLNEKRDLQAAYNFYCQKILNNAHSALCDAQATLEILRAQTIKYGKEGEIESLGQFNYIKKTEFYDQERKFRWWNGKLYMMFGRYAKKYSLQDIVKKDPDYLEWIISADFSAEIKLLVEEALKGKFPEYKDGFSDDLFESGNKS